MADPVQQPTSYAVRQIGLTSAVPHGSPSSIHRSELTAMPLDPPTLDVLFGLSNVIASPVDLNDDAGQGKAYNIAVPARVVHRPPPRNAPPCKNVAEWIELEPALIIEPANTGSSDPLPSAQASEPCIQIEEHRRRKDQVSGQNEENALQTDQGLEDPRRVTFVAGEQDSVELEQGFTIHPLSPTTMADWRYRDRIKITNDSETIIIEPVDIGLSRPAVPNWTLCIHPEGQPYYRRGYRIDRENRNISIYTDQNLEDPGTLELIDYCVERFLSHMDRYPHVPLDFDLVLYACQRNMGCADLETTRDLWYYLATDDRRWISWVQRVPLHLVTNNQRVVCSKYQLGDAYESQYWAHKELYPNGWHVSHGILTELTESLHYLAVDTNTSETSTSPWDFRTVRDHLSIVEKINPGKCTGQSSCIVARLMHSLATNRFQHYHGEPYARLNINDSVKEDRTRRPLERSLWFLCVLPLCFYLPDQYLEELEAMYVDDLVHYKLWNRYIEGLKQDWESVMLPVTVLLTVNVGLLAIQSVDTNHPVRSVAQLSSYCSAIMSLGAIVMCIILSRHHRRSGHSKDMSEVGDWLKNRVCTRWQAEIFVVTLSLPSAWFTWGVIMFCVSLLWVAFDRTSWVTRVLAVIVALPTLAVVSWVVTSAWKHNHRRAYLTGRLCDMVSSQWIQARSSISTWTPTLWRPSALGRQGDIEQGLSETSAV